MTSSSHTGSNAPVLIAGQWRPAGSNSLFQVENPSTGELLPARYPVSSRDDMLAALKAGRDAATQLETVPPASIAAFLNRYADEIEKRRSELVELAHQETGLPKTPRLNDAELPRTTDQLRQGARVALEGSWRSPVRDDARKIYSGYAPLGGAVVVMGPNNFPFAFNSIAGGDFVAALVAHNPVIAKANTGHPGVTRLFAEIAFECLKQSGLPLATVQLLYRVPPDVGFELVSHPFVGATAFTGSRTAGLKLKEAADRAGKPVYLEMSSVNPIVLLKGALLERGDAIAEEFFGSCTMGAGQFCTNPGLVIVPGTPEGEKFVLASREKFSAGKPGVLLGKGVLQSLVQSVAALRQAGAELLCGGKPVAGAGFRFENTLLRVTAAQFKANARALQTEAFGPVALLVMSESTRVTAEILEEFEGNLTGTIYPHSGNSDEADYKIIEPVLRQKVGRLLNDKMPTGVAVSPAMNHGGPYPSTGHPGFTAVGLPASIRRFAALQCYDNVRPDRLPAWLRVSQP